MISSYNSLVNKTYRRPYENTNNRSQGVRRKEPGGKSKEHIGKIENI